MVTCSDFITISYSSDLTQAGIAYGLHSLPYSYPQAYEDTLQRLRRLVASKGVELAFKRYLIAQEIPHKVWGTINFTKPEDCNLELGGLKCVLTTAFISNKGLIRKVHQSSDTLSPVQVAIPSEQVPGLSLARKNIYVFAFLTALTANTRQRVDQALKAGQDTCLVHSLPFDKFHPKQWSSFGEVSLKCDTSEHISVTLGGQNSNQEFQTEHLVISPRKRIITSTEFYSLCYLMVKKWPDGVVGIHSPLWGKPYLISPSQWANIWVYGMKIIFVGYLPGESFIRKAQRLPGGQYIFSGRKIRVENLVLQVRDLRPLQELFCRTREWAREM